MVRRLRARARTGWLPLVIPSQPRPQVRPDGMAHGVCWRRGNDAQIAVCDDLPAHGAHPTEHEVLCHELGHALGWDDEDAAEAFAKAFGTAGARPWNM